MKIRIKTEEELLRDGWVETSYDDEKSFRHPDVYLDIYGDMVKLFNKELDVEHIDLEYDGTVLADYWWHIYAFEIIDE